MTEIHFIINNSTYTKDQILADDQLKKDYLEIIKYNKHKEKTRNRMRELRQDELFKEQQRIKINKRYAEDAEYRASKLENSRQQRLINALLTTKPIRKRGRPLKYTLNNNLECVSIC